MYQALIPFAQNKIDFPDLVMEKKFDKQPNDHVPKKCGHWKAQIILNFRGKELQDLKTEMKMKISAHL